MYFGKIILAAIERVHKNNCYSMCKFVGLYLKRSYCYSLQKLEGFAWEEQISYHPVMVQWR